MTVYLDTSAITKLVRREPETDALRQRLGEPDGAHRVSSALVLTELRRAVGDPDERVEALLSALDLVTVDDELLTDAGRLLTGTRLRSLDAIHLAAVRRLGSRVSDVITYDHRMADAARAMGLRVTAPA